MTRDSKGRFIKGQSGNPNGGRRSRTSQEFLDQVRTAVTVEDWGRVIDKAITQAKSGNPIARKWLSDYLIGLPTQRHEVSFGDGDLDAAIEAELAKLAANRKVAAIGAAEKPEPDGNGVA